MGFVERLRIPFIYNSCCKKDKIMNIVPWIFVVAFVVFPVIHFARVAFFALRKEKPKKYSNAKDEQLQQSMRKNKKIIGWATAIFNAALIPLLNRSMGGLWSFNWVTVDKLLQSIPGIIGIWFVFGIIPASESALFALFVYAFLHRKESPFSRKIDHPYEEELYFGCILALWITYGGLMVFIAWNLIAN